MEDILKELMRSYATSTLLLRKARLMLKYNRGDSDVIAEIGEYVGGAGLIIRRMAGTINNISMLREDMQTIATLWDAQNSAIENSQNMYDAHCIACGILKKITSTKTEDEQYKEAEERIRATALYYDTKGDTWTTTEGVRRRINSVLDALSDKEKE